LENENFSAVLRDRLRDPDRLAEHERGLELQINFPESTLATMLPIVNVIEAATVLKKEFFSIRLEARVKEPVRLLARPLIWEAARDTEPDRLFARPLVSAPARVSEPVRDLNREVCSEKLVDRPREPVKLLPRVLT